MNCKIYYGEYSLEHWVKLIFKKNIILPKYQRYFVWDKEKTLQLIETFHENQFVPPVTIGFFNKDGKSENLILDGQQRLTSILLSYLGLFPKKSDIDTPRIDTYADENDNPDEEELFDNVLEWSFKRLTEKGKSKTEILEKISQKDDYLPIPSIDDNFLKSHFMGFSYMVPQTSDSKEQQRFYSSIFRNINIQGETLLPQESRESLYFLNEDFVDFFKPEFAKSITVNDKKMDFVRYLALLTQYHKEQNQNKVAYRFAGRMEKFYEEYIYFIINSKLSPLFGEFPEKYKNKGYTALIRLIRENISLVTSKRSFDSIIELDMFFLGLIYFSLFHERIIDADKKEALVSKISSATKEFRDDPHHKKSPSKLKYLRSRLRSSINIYEEYMKYE